MPRSFEDAVREAQKETFKIMVDRHSDYGPDNIMRHLETGLIVRIDDKLARLNNMLTGKREPKGERIIDSWVDISNYGIIGIMLRKGTFTIPLERDIVKEVTPNGGLTPENIVGKLHNSNGWEG